MTEPPKAFLSYSWSSPEYAERVLGLAERLTTDGVHVILDRWDLKEGQDKHHFMEQAVTDVTVRRVLVLCDPTYAAKADGREGGVGTETLIISPEVYREARQEKFIPVVMERDGSGEVVVPTYLNGRIYVDLSDPSNDTAEYERLVRNIFDKPEIARPAIGRPPAYLEEGRSPLLTGRSLLTFCDAVVRGRPHQKGLLDDYLGKVLDALRAQIIPAPETVEQLDEAILSSVEAFLPYRTEFLDQLSFLGKADDAPEFFEQLHHFYEEALSIREGHRPGRWNEHETENLAFLNWELFLHTVAGALRFGQFRAIDQLLEPYVVTDWMQAGGRVRDFSALDRHCEILQKVSQKRLGTRYLSFASHLLRDRVSDRRYPFEALLEADLVLWLRAATDERRNSWYPQTLVYAESMPILPLFTRGNASGFFQRFAPALGVSDITELRDRFAAIPVSMFPQVGNFWGGRGGYAELLQLDKLASR